MGLIYHITYATEWDKALAAGSYTMSTRGVTLAEQGFIHASTAAQVAATAGRFYAGEEGLIILTIDEELVEPEIKYEPAPGTDEFFPHIYGPLNTSAVTETRPLEPPPTGESGT